MQPGDCEIQTAVRIVIVDDHLMFRRGVRAVLETYAEQVAVNLGAEQWLWRLHQSRKRHLS